MRVRLSFTRVLIAAFTFSLVAPSLALADDGHRGKFPAAHEEFLGADSSAFLFPRLDDAPGDSSSSSDEEELSLSVGPNVRVNAPQSPFPAGLLGRSENTVASDKEGKRIVVGWNDAQGFCGPPFGAACTPQSPTGLSGYGFSTDSGATWTDGGAPPVLGGVFTRGDPWMDRGGKTFFYANLAVDATSGADLGISVHRGHFTGGTFTWDDVHVFNSPNGANDFYDKEAIAADHRKHGKGFAVVSVTNFQELCGIPQNGFGQIEVWRTTNGGNTWQGPAIAGPEAADSVAACGNLGTLQQSSVPAIGPKGEVYVVWQFGPTFTATGTSTGAQIRVARSLNGGVSFNTPVTVASINSFRQDTQVGYNRDRMNDHPRIAVATSGEHKGRVYVTFYSALAPVTAAAITPCPAPNIGSSCRAQRLTSSQIFLSHSDNRGQTWSTPVPIAPAPPATGVKRFWPVVTVGEDDEVNVVFQESQEKPIASGAVCNVSVGGGLRRRGTAHSLVDTFIAQSDDGGASFGPPVKVSSVTSDWCTTVSNVRPNFGDYIGSFGAHERILAAWGDGRNGVPDTFFAAITQGEEEDKDKDKDNDKDKDKDKDSDTDED